MLSVVTLFTYIATFLSPIIFMEIVLSPDEKIEDLMIKGFKIIQSKKLYRFTSDAVLLSRFASQNAKNVLDLCAGSGIVGLHYHALNSVESLTAVEIQPSLASLCSKNMAINGLSADFLVKNQSLCGFDGGNSFDLVLCNPPYKKAGSGFVPLDEHLAICRAEVKCTLDDIVKCAARSLKRGGKLCMCHKPERLTELIVSFANHGINPSRLQFVSGKGRKEPYLVLIEGVKGKNPQLKVMTTVENLATDFSGEVK